MLLALEGSAEGFVFRWFSVWVDWVHEKVSPPAIGIVQHF